MLLEELSDKLIINLRKKCYYLGRTQASQVSPLSGVSLSCELIMEVTTAGKMAHLRQAPSTANTAPRVTDTKRQEIFTKPFLRVYKTGI